MNKSPVTPPRITSLDALRGIAALVVLACHLQHSFFPGLYRHLKADQEGTMALVPATFLLNGGAAVTLFFVLSGFVLTQRFFESGKILDIPDSILKRWPRLAGPVILVSLISGFLIGFGLYRNLPVAALNGSWWLKESFNWSPRGYADVINALNQGAVGTFLGGVCDYNGAFWTMHFEFVGSIAVYVLAALIVMASRYLDWRLLFLGMMLLWAREVIRFPFMASFILGTMLALVYTKFPRFVWKSTSLLWIGGILCILGGGFTIPENDLPDRWYTSLGMDTVSGRLSIRYFIDSLIAFFFLSAGLWMPAIREFLSRPLLRKLGHLSFPIYLIHTPVICFVGAWIYLGLHPRGATLASIIAILVSALLTLLLAIPLAAFDDLWLLLVRRITPIKTLWKGRFGKAPALG
jgi:peptidoglycan/LPS O-acetylase OafA/YrhL